MAALVEIIPSAPAGAGGRSVTGYHDAASAQAIVLTTGTQIKIANNGRVFIRVRRTSTVASQLTITTEQTVEGLAVADRNVTMPVVSGALWEGGPYDPRVYNDADGKMSIEFSAVDGVDLSAVQR